MIRMIEQPERGCGRRKEGGYYITSERSENGNGAVPIFVPINPPIPLEDALVRGYKTVDGGAILKRLPEDQWLAGTSRESADKHNGDQWAIDTFGMTITQRCRVGECTMCGSADTALELLVNAVTWSDFTTQAVKALSQSGVTALPRVAPDFAALVSSLQRFARTENYINLVAASAACWRIADKLPPSTRGKYVPIIAAIVGSIGLKKDSVALRIRYKKP